MKRKLKTILLILLSWLVLHAVFILFDGHYDANEKKQFAVIFGTTVHQNGQLSDRLKARLDKSIQLYNDSLISNLFVSGGLGKEGHYEGTKMCEYLIRNGVPQSHIYIDNKGNNTKLTAQNFVAMFPKEKSVVVISQYFHLTRAKLAFKKVNVHDVTSAHPNYYEWRDVYSTFREFFGYYKYLLFF